MPNVKSPLKTSMKNAAIEEREQTPVILPNAPDHWIFALDVGTRTIIGIVGIERQERFEVLAAEVLEHTHRAMLDGQIHDIAKVAMGAQKVKNALENKLGFTLTTVAIAAAGRVLKTSQVHVEREIDDSQEIDAQLIGALEMEGVRLAQDNLLVDALEQDRNLFHCVGYSVINYYLNDYIFSNLQGHRGNRISIDLLATFLPHMVVDSLHTVMDRIGLQVTSMTLEPIAALNVAIPSDLRLLNLGLVDIGAGTSDIAITKGGTVIGYAMAPIAGDELTEAIAQHYLLDFTTAEKLKIQSGTDMEELTFIDILDNHITVKTQEIRDVLEPVSHQLAEIITHKILESNMGKPPHAVFLVGGGSLTRGLSDKISLMLGMAKDRVAVRNRSIAKNIDMSDEVLQGPECITPLGIMVTASMNAGKDFFHVSVGNQRVRLFNSRKMTVADALLLAGYIPDQLIGRSGKTLRFSLNGTEKTVRGTYGSPAEITCNGALCGLTTTIQAGDKITVKGAEKGIDGSATVGDFVSSAKPVRFISHDNSFEIPNIYLLNGNVVDSSTMLVENDILEVIPPKKLRDVIELLELSQEHNVFYSHDLCVDDSYALAPGDVIRAVPMIIKVPTGTDISNDEKKRFMREVTPEQFDRPSAKSLTRDKNQNAANIQKDFENVKDQAKGDSDIENTALTIDDITGNTTKKAGNTPTENLFGIQIIVNNEKIYIPKVRNDMMFVDVFSYISFDLADPKGTIALKLNGKEAGYTDILHQEDVLEIYWNE